MAQFVLFCNKSKFNKSLISKIFCPVNIKKYKKLVFANLLY